MGWLWNSSTTPRTSPDQPTSDPNTQQQPQQPQPQSQPSAPPTREEQADAELSQLWASFKEDIARESNSNSASTSTSSSTTTSSPPQHQTQSPSSTSSSIHPDSLYPTTLSCRNAFDYAFFCQSFGGQFVNVYRYGELRSCSPHWDDFWLCMKTRNWGDEARAKAVKDHYRRKNLKYKTGPSSEDVWDMRMRPVRGAFEGDFAALEREMQKEEKGGI